MRLMSLLLLAATGAASAQSPDDFAWQWPITATGDDGAHALVLDDAVYARITRSDLRDLAVFNADGQPVPFAPLPWPTTTQASRTQLNWLRLPVATDSAGESLSLRIARDPDGTVRASGSSRPVRRLSCSMRSSAGQSSPGASARRR